MPLRRLLIAGGFAALIGGFLAGLARLGLGLPEPLMPWAAIHGPLMVCGFLGALISLERAVALERAWGFGAPFLCILGAGLALSGSGLAAWAVGKLLGAGLA